MRSKTKSDASRKGKPWAVSKLSAAQPNGLSVELDAGETSDGMLAKTALRPAVRAAVTIANLDRYFGDMDLTTLVGKIGTQVSAIQGGDLGRSEEMLITQAHTLDMLFNQLVLRSARNGDAGYLEVAETYMRLALRAQGQCRATLETLSVVKNPPSVSFVRQANISNGPQQINNGQAPPAEASRARESENQPNKLLEQQRNDWMDARTEGAAGSSNSPVETLAAINGTKDDRG